MIGLSLQAQQSYNVWPKPLIDNQISVTDQYGKEIKTISQKNDAFGNYYEVSNGNPHQNTIIRKNETIGGQEIRTYNAYGTHKETYTIPKNMEIPNIFKWQQ